MKHFKFLLINIVAFSFLFFLLSLLFPGQVITSKTVTISGSKEKLVSKLNDTTAWKQWNSFVQNNVVGESHSANSDTLNYAFTSINDNTLHSQFFLFDNAGNSVLLNWNLVEKLPWYKPWKKFSAMVLSKNVAVVMDSSLIKLKALVEAAP
ncbi:hypothetical protein [Ferruginibacter sp.]